MDVHNAPQGVVAFEEPVNQRGHRADPAAVGSGAGAILAGLCITAEGADKFKIAWLRRLGPLVL